jgi:hypothetical protein
MDATTNRETPCGAGNACADRGRGDAPRPMVGVVVGRQVQQQLTATRTRAKRLLLVPELYVQ